MSKYIKILGLALLGLLVFALCKELLFSKIVTLIFSKFYRQTFFVTGRLLVV